MDVLKFPYTYFSLWYIYFEAILLLLHTNFYIFPLRCFMSCFLFQRLFYLLILHKYIFVLVLHLHSAPCPYCVFYLSEQLCSRCIVYNEHVTDLGICLFGYASSLNGKFSLFTLSVFTNRIFLVFLSVIVISSWFIFINYFLSFYVCLLEGIYTIPSL